MLDDLEMLSNPRGMSNNAINELRDFAHSLASYPGKPEYKRVAADSLSARQAHMPRNTIQPARGTGIYHYHSQFAVPAQPDSPQTVLSVRTLLAHLFAFANFYSFSCFPKPGRS
ncbi:hypothetical protein Bbelb_030600 [Branchiostoma belcheri]|nr:hypothetical protein Bbelb_030600 [Branchiostoma belcheri]